MVIVLKEALPSTGIMIPTECRHECLYIAVNKTDIAGFPW